MGERMKQIQAIENKYGLTIFRMGLTHLIDVGVRHLTDESVAETIEQLMEEGKKEKDTGIMPILTVEFRCEIVRCALELSKVGIWDLIAYIKNYVTVNKER